jgi:hypothetical protein
MSLGVESYSCILLATWSGNQQDANVAPVAAVYQGKRVADYASPHDPSGLYRSPRPRYFPFGDGSRITRGVKNLAWIDPLP